MERIKVAVHTVSRAFRCGYGIIKRYRTTVACIITALLFSFSFIMTPSRDSTRKEAARLERKIKQRQQILERYVYQALETPVDKWLELEDFPDDMVIYKYNADTIQSWLNQFPINNDEVDVIPLWYRLHYMNSKSLFNTPLAYLTEREQYVNLGSAWYVVKVYKQERIKIVAGLLIKTDYLSDNAVLVSKINPNLGIDKKLTLSPVNFDEGRVITGKDGGVLFSVIDDITAVRSGNNGALKWLSFLFALLALYSYFYNRKSFKAFAVYITGITILWITSLMFGNYLRLDTPIFSPSLYADTGIFSSLGNLLINNLYVFLFALSVYVIRKDILRLYKIVNRIARCAVVALLVVLPLFVAWYINFTLHSLINNSNIILELYRVQELGVYSVMCYFSYGLLSIALLLLLQVALSVTKLYGRVSLLNIKYLLAYIFIFSAYMLATISMLGYDKELVRSKMWTNKLLVERDLGLELQLRSIESKLPADPILRNIIELQQQGTDVRSLLYNRMTELYLQDISQKYEIQLTFCRPNESLLHNNGQRIIGNCNSYFQNAIVSNGSPISDKYVFFFMNNYNGRVSYLGMVTFYNEQAPISLYIELNSRYMKDVIGYPALLFNYKQADNFNMPASYSYAKYMEERLTIYRGDYNYSTTVDFTDYPDGFSTFTQDGYLHFANKFSSDNLIIISRPKRDMFVYLVSFSYLVLFFSAMFSIFVRMRLINKRALKMRFPKNSFRRKVTYLLTFSLVISLLCVGLGSIWFSVRYYNDANKVNMEEKLHTTQSSLSDFCKYTEHYTELNTPDLYQLMDRMANNAQVDINLYDPHGRLIRSTQSELFEKYLLSSRMNADAYKQIVFGGKRQVVNRESIAELSYHSLYAPITNSEGKLIAIVNIPYFTKSAGLTGDISSIVAAIVNVYILLLLAAIFGGTIISNSLARPLAEISRKMQRVDISGQAEHINYKNRDELGILVGAYNKMVDDLEESTKRLAQTEREHAWSEMARQIAHEIKNPLTPMRLSIQHLIRLKQRGVDGWEEKFEEVAGSILEQIDILSNTASEFSSFAKFYYEESSKINLFTIITEQKILFDTRDNIKILFNSAQEQALVFARKGQIIRVIVNLLSNAIQALEAEGRGYVKISLVREKENYVVSIEDNGPGVKDEDVGKLFKPNFTTKSSGTGLGLAISRNIIEQSGGTIYYSRSELGGANFSFTLPVYV